MNPISIAELVSAVFVGIVLTGLINKEDRSDSVKWLKSSLIAMFIYLIVDAAAYSLTEPEIPFLLRYLANFLAYSTGSCVIVCFVKYSEVYIGEKAPLKRWTFRIPAFASIACVCATAVEFLLGNLVVFENGVIAAENDYPVYLRLLQVFVMVYIPAVAFIKRKHIGMKAVLLLGCYSISPILASVIAIFTNVDITPVFGAASIVLVVVLLQRDSARRRLEQINAGLKESNELLEKELLLEQTVAEQNAFTKYLLQPYESAYYIGLGDLHWQAYKLQGDQEGPYPVQENYIETWSSYIQNNIHPDDMGKMSVLTEPDRLRQILAGQQEYTFTFRKVSEAEEKILRCEVVRGADGDHAAIGFKNITGEWKRKQEQDIANDLANQQRHIRSFGEMVNAALWSMNIDENDRVTGVFWSDELRRMFGFDGTAEDFPNALESWTSRIHPSDADETMEHFRESLKSRDTEGCIFDTEYRFLRKNGGYCWYHTVGRMEYNEDGSRKLYGIMYDISADKQLEEQRIQLKAALDAARREQRRTDILHEIIHSGKWSLFVSEDDTVTGANVSEEANSIINNDVPADGFSWLDVVHPDDRDGARAAFIASIRDHTGRTPYDVNYRMQGRDGEYRWFHSAGRIIRDGDGNGEFFGIHVDITDQMEEQQKRLLGAIPLSPDVLAKANIGMWAFEFDEGQAPRMYADETMLSLIGLDHQVTPEETYHAWYDHIDSDSGDLVADAVARMSSGEHAEVQFPWHHPDGHTLVVRCGGVRNPEYRKGVRIEGTHQDVTQTIHFDEEERRKAKLLENELVKSKLRADSLAYIADNEPDIDSAIDFFGKRILEISGCDQVLFCGTDGHRIALSAPGVQDIPSEVCMKCPFSDLGSELFGDDGMIVMNDCEESYGGMSAHPGCPARSSMMQLVYSGGKLAGKISVLYLREQHTFSENFIDIMKTVAAYCGLLIGRINEKKAERAKLEAESSSKAKTEFLFNMSHDIRTPMNAILGYTDIALSHIGEQERVHDSLNKIKTSGGHLLSLINDILEMSRIEAGKIELARAPLNINEATDGLVHMAEALAVTKDIEFVTEIGEMSNPYVFADELHTNQVLINLVSNAIKYTDPGGKVEYRIEQIGLPENGAARYRFAVRDNGIGMSDEFQKHLFESFSRENTAAVSRREGAGLGLAIVKRIIDLMGGTISVKSRKGEGSEFTVEIPLEVMDDEAIAGFKAERGAVPGIGEDRDLEGRKALVVDDNNMNREIAAEILEDTGLVVDTAEDGAIAVSRVTEKGAGYYDFILMDIQMPVMNGFEATSAIRGLPGGDSVPIIALSANAFREDVEKSLAAGMDAHIAKPIDIGTLMDTLHRLSSGR